MTAVAERFARYLDSPAGQHALNPMNIGPLEVPLCYLCKRYHEGVCDGEGNRPRPSDLLPLHEHDSGSDSPCCVCGKHIAKPTWHVHDARDLGCGCEPLDLGWFPVGPECKDKARLAGYEVEVLD